MTADADLLAMLDAFPGLTLVPKGSPGVPSAVYDGYVDTNETEKVISVPLPYVVFYSTPGYDNDDRFCGDVGGRVLEFSITGVGADRAQAKAVLDKARAALSRKRLGAALIRRSAENNAVRREDVYTAPGGAPLFYGIDSYAVAV